MDKSFIINEIKLYLNIKTDSEFADFLGVKQPTISTWRKRNTIDYELIIAKCNKINGHWLLTGQGSMLKSEPQPAVSSPQPQENDKYISSLEKQIVLLEKNNALLEDKITHLEQRLELAELKDKEAMALKIKKQRKEIDQKDEIINLQNEELNAMKSISLPSDKPLHPSKRV